MPPLSWRTHHQPNRGQKGGGGENQKGMAVLHLPSGLGGVVDPTHLAPIRHRGGWGPGTLLPMEKEAKEHLNRFMGALESAGTERARADPEPKGGQGCAIEAVPQPGACNLDPI
jgi:hypothetical protein